MDLIDMQYEDHSQDEEDSNSPVTLEQGNSIMSSKKLPSFIEIQSDEGEAEIFK